MAKQRKPFSHFMVSRSRPKHSKKQEARIAKRSGGRVQPASGAIEGLKGDVVDGHGELLIEAKTTEKKSLGVKREWLEKISKEAQDIGRIPCLSISFTTINKKMYDEDWACVPFGWLMRVLDMLKIEEENMEGG